MKYFVSTKCGCRFPIIDGLIKFDASLSKLPLDCSITWNLFKDGNTKGIFQLESQLGQSISKQVKPKNIEELAAVISIMRPGSMEAVLNNKTLTQHYIDRKNLVSAVEYFHSALEPILKDTYGVMIYQEQALFIAKEIAGFSLQEADELRRAIGKKKADAMAKMESKFIKGAINTKIVNEQEAKEIFGWIKASQRYSFNKSHAVGYAIGSYQSAYTKAHFTPDFFRSYLTYSTGKPKPYEEIRDLVNNAKLFDINVISPDIREKNNDFRLKDRSNIIYGLLNIKNIGQSLIDNAYNELNKFGDISEIDWCTILIHILPNINSRAVRSLISVGALDFLNKQRTEMLYDYTNYMYLTDKEREYITGLEYQEFNSCKDIFTFILKFDTGKGKPISSVKRKEKIRTLFYSLEHPPYALKDTPEWIAGVEEELLGIPITYSHVDSCDTFEANSTCSDFSKGKNDYVIIAAQIDRLKEITIKRGKSKGRKAAFLDISDGSGSLNSVTCWSDVWEKCRNEIIQGNTVMVCGTKDKKTGNLVVKKIWQIS